VPTIADLAASADSGDPAAAATLFERLYAELHRLARRELAKGGGPGSLGATTLLHEAYVDMSGREHLDFPDRARFMGYAARVMRGLIVEHARNGRAQKRGGHFEITALVTDIAENLVQADELSSISDALDELADLDPPLAQIVDLKFFCGFSFSEIAAMQGVSERTVQRNWEKARIVLHRALRADSLAG
jgi:RNA polymerase sigma factor (TIGR02999 family)